MIDESSAAQTAALAQAAQSRRTKPKRLAKNAHRLIKIVVDYSGAVLNNQSKFCQRLFPIRL